MPINRCQMIIWAWNFHNWSNLVLLHYLIHLRWLILKLLNRVFYRINFLMGTDYCIWEIAGVVCLTHRAVGLPLFSGLSSSRTSTSSFFSLLDRRLFWRIEPFGRRFFLIISVDKRCVLNLRGFRCGGVILVPGGVIVVPYWGFDIITWVIDDYVGRFVLAALSWFTFVLRLVWTRGGDVVSSRLLRWGVMPSFTDAA